MSLKRYQATGTTITLLFDKLIESLEQDPVTCRVFHPIGELDTASENVIKNHDHSVILISIKGESGGDGEIIIAHIFYRWLADALNTDLEITAGGPP